MYSFWKNLFLLATNQMGWLTDVKYTHFDEKIKT